jgi:hypothetical protein
VVCDPFSRQYRNLEDVEHLNNDLNEP